MPETDQLPDDTAFRQGMAARAEGLTPRDNPYAAGSPPREDWHAGFCATVAPEDEDEPAPGEPSAAGAAEPTATPGDV